MEETKPDDGAPTPAAQEPAPAEVIARLRPAALQRGIGLSFVVIVGAFFLWTGVLSSPENELGNAGPFLVVAGTLALWFALRLWRATAVGLELTDEELRDTNGRVLARLDQILSVDRGTFAFKPSGGFVLRLTEAPGAAWQPGLWWRFGTRLGVGGVTSRAEARFLADTIMFKIVEREL